MPNWVYSGFNASGPQSEIDRFERTMFRMVPRRDVLGAGTETDTEIVLDFNGIIPMPQEAKEHDPEGWAVEHWGVKWNAWDLLLSPRTNPERFHFQFATPWDFPYPVFDALAKEFPALVFSGSAYEENHAFELVGEFNGEDDWGPGEIEWLIIGGEGDEEDDAEGSGSQSSGEGE